MTTTKGRLIAVATAICVLASSATAQAPMQVAPQGKTYTLRDLSPEELKTIGEGLAALPYSRVAPLMHKLQTQVSAQEAQAPEKPADGK